MGGKNRFVQDTEVLIYRLTHGNVREAKRLMEQLCLVAESLAQDLEEGDRKRFLEGTSELMARLRKRTVELEEAGTPEAEVAETILSELNEHVAHDLREFSLDVDTPGEATVGAESTLDGLIEENEWLRAELERSERDYMELYERLRRTDEPDRPTGP